MTPQWRKSSRSGGVDDKACVEVARLDGANSAREVDDPAAVAPAQ